ncbi:cytochrome P450 [Mycolicibacterium fallax]|uniref:Steroid C26-monooxygenase n=1 Tax=Mycolicibacterium fallax TaxID=1793 RepID=A0A1X1RI13_MYCFA|nr:cytochrome P450 [Mycolicibacterium fallax]ORV06679.1 cytochrome [Mycolicibacterium fallax]BBY96625.1 cytochrome P450 [Mycolicibacterium fallax]HOW93091.1 cytochrome P450 [Mycolicibacterium fallax]
MTKPSVVFDPFSDEYYNDPYDIYLRMQDEAPVYYSAEHDFYALTRHADVAAALKDHETYSSSRGCDLSMIRSEEGVQKSIIFMDPPDHRYLRSLVNKAFTPRAVQSQRETIEHLVDQYLSKVDPEHFDVVADFSGPFPVEVITRMAGVPEEYRQKVREWIDTSLSREPGQMGLTEAGMAASIESGMYYYKLAQDRRANPQDDMISRLIAAEVPDDAGGTRTLDDIEIAGFTSLLGGAGAETVTKLVGSAVVTFARHPEQWEKLRNDRSLLPGAVEEMLRFDGPVHYNVRFTLREATLHGVTIPAGKPVFLMKAAANRDPRAFSDAGVFDIERDRTEAQNMGFGYGIHSCLGAALARLETIIAMDRLLDFMPRYEVQWDGLQRVHMQNVAGYHHVPVKVL